MPALCEMLLDIKEEHFFFCHCVPLGIWPCCNCLCGMSHSLQWIKLQQAASTLMPLSHDMAKQVMNRIRVPRERPYVDRLVKTSPSASSSAPFQQENNVTQRHSEIAKNFHQQNMPWTMCAFFLKTLTVSSTLTFPKHYSTFMTVLFIVDNCSSTAYNWSRHSET